ncbi:hypothetical protein HDU82_002505, partial [Entophlyctis luteolus]
MDASTGWTYNYTWGAYDYATWCGCLMVQLFLNIPIIYEALLNRKRTVIWMFVAIALLLQIANVVSNLCFIDCVLFASPDLDPGDCMLRAHWAYFFNCAVFTTGFVLLFYRKYKVAPETLFLTGLIDLIVVSACIALNVTANVPCIEVDLDTCFTADVFQAFATGISIVYFDAWFLVKMMRRKMEKFKRVEVIQ